nr:Flp pilus assembly protein TadD [Stenotrophomonas maltophilia]
MPALRTSCLLLALAAVASGCASTTPKYLRAPSLAAPEPAPQDSRNAYLELIGRMQQQGAWYASLAHVDAFRQRYGDPPALRLLRADALRETGQADAAITLYRELSTGPQAAAAAHGLGLIAARRDDDGGSEEALARATQLQPLNTDYLGDLGYARLRAGQFEQAREPLAKALELSPGNPKATANLALWAVLRGDAATAERLAEQAKTQRGHPPQHPAAGRADPCSPAAAPGRRGSCRSRAGPCACYRQRCRQQPARRHATGGGTTPRQPR